LDNNVGNKNNRTTLNSNKNHQEGRRNNIYDGRDLKFIGKGGEEKPRTLDLDQ